MPEREVKKIAAEFLRPLNQGLAAVEEDTAEAGDESKQITAVMSRANMAPEVRPNGTAFFRGRIFHLFK